MGKPKQNESMIGKRVLDILLSLALVGGIGCGAAYVIKSGGRISQTNTYEVEQDGTQPTEENTTAENKTIYQNEEHPNIEMYNGSLMLVNRDEPFRGTDEDLVSLYETRLESDSHSFSVRDGLLQVRQEVADQLILMFDAFYEATFDDNILVQSGHRTKEHQQELYDSAELDEEGNNPVAKPGYSEHQTGYCVDLSVLGEEEYDGSGVYAWINEHCAEYGFVLRYAENKTDVTKMEYEPWHYRYVGTPHAQYMTENGLCLEEYAELLKEYPYEGEHLVMADHEGTMFEVYYVAAAVDFNTTMVPVPASTSYTVSGNNADGFIVTAKLGKDAQAAAATSESSETDSENSDAASETSEQDAE